jgi:hypothetical protein
LLLSSWGAGRRRGVAGSHSITPSAARLRSTYREEATMQPNIRPKSSLRRRNPLPQGGKPSTAGNRRRGSRIRPLPRPVVPAAAARRRRSSRARHTRLRSPSSPSGRGRLARHERRAPQPGVARRRGVGGELEASSLRIAQGTGRGPRAHPNGIRPRLPVHWRTADEWRNCRA